MMVTTTIDQFCDRCEKWKSSICSVSPTSCFDCCEHLICTVCGDRCATIGHHCEYCNRLATQVPKLTCNHVVYDCKAGCFSCENCHSELHIGLPMEVSAAAKISRDFLKVHLDCKPQETAEPAQFSPKFIKFIQQNLVEALKSLKDNDIYVNMETKDSIFSFSLLLTTEPEEG